MGINMRRVFAAALTALLLAGATNAGAGTVVATFSFPGIARDDGSGRLSWHLRTSNSTGGSNIPTFHFGDSDTDFPVTGDWNHDYRDTVGVVRLIDGQPITWYLRNSNNTGPSNLHFNFGKSPGDIPVVGDWNGDGTDSIGVVRQDGSGRLVWYLKFFNSAGGSNVHFIFGKAGDRPVVGDWDGDGDDNIGIARNDGSGHLVWYLRNTNSAGGSNTHFAFGAPTDFTVVGDWNRDAKDTIGFVRRRSSDKLEWHIRNTNSAGPSSVVFTYGTAPAAVVTGAWNTSGQPQQQSNVPHSG